MTRRHDSSCTRSGHDPHPGLDRDREAPLTRGRAGVALVARAALVALSALATLASPCLTAPAPAPAPSSSAPSTPSASSPSSAPSPSTAPPTSAADPWSWLTRVRRSLVAAGPTTANFSQTYIPAGFTSGEKESGSLSLHLPDCLRWDYQDPYPKGFLLCGDMVQAWNPEDHTGRRYRIDRKNEPGLDLLLLGVDDLKARYNAVTRSSPNGQIEIALSPKGKAGELSDAALAIDPTTLRVVQVSYHDREGNLTRFLLAGYRPLAQPGQFSAPPGIQWEEQP